MENQIYKQIIEKYIDSYNHFDTETMLSDMDNDICFENISNGQTTLTLHGKEALKNQVQQVNHYFKSRKQTVSNYIFYNEKVEITIDYTAILAIDLPKGLKAGETFSTKGKSIFTFKNNKIIELKDIS
jgi:hypothetical protein